MWTTTTSPAGSPPCMLQSSAEAPHGAAARRSTMKVFTMLLAAGAGAGHHGCRRGPPPGRRRFHRPPVFQRDAAPGTPPAMPPAAPSNAAAQSAPGADPAAGAAAAQPLGRHAGRPGRRPGPGVARAFAGPGRRLRPVPAVRADRRGPDGRVRCHAPSRRAAGGPAWQGATADAPVSPRQYNPAKVGNDASARPWESGFDVQHAAPACASAPRSALALAWKVRRTGACRRASTPRVSCRRPSATS